MCTWCLHLKRLGVSMFGWVSSSSSDTSMWSHTLQSILDIMPANNVSSEYDSAKLLGFNGADQNPQSKRRINASTLHYSKTCICDHRSGWLGFYPRLTRVKLPSVSQQATATGFQKDLLLHISVRRHCVIASLRHKDA